MELAAEDTKPGALSGRVQRSIGLNRSPALRPYRNEPFVIRRGRLWLSQHSHGIGTLQGWACVIRSGFGQTGEINDKVDKLEQQVEQLRAQIQALRQQAAAQPAAPIAPPVAVPIATAGASPVERKDGKGMTFLTRGGEVSFYANLDLSIDDMSKGLHGKTADGAPPVGRTGWMPDISSNISYIGIRGFQKLGALPANFVYQLETQIDVSATSGTNGSNSNTSDVVEGGLTSRNGFIGFASPVWGVVKIGKTDAPYKLSTNVMNAFGGMIGDHGQHRWRQPGRVRDPA